jgi:hypothetical protein
VRRALPVGAASALDLSSELKHTVVCRERLMTVVRFAKEATW